MINDKIEINKYCDSITKENSTILNYYLRSGFEMHKSFIFNNTILNWHAHLDIVEILFILKGNIVIETIEDFKLVKNHLVEGDLVKVNNSVHRLVNKFSKSCEFIIFRFIPPKKKPKVAIEGDGVSFSPKEIETLLQMDLNSTKYVLLSDLDGTIILQGLKRVSSKSRILIHLLKKAKIIDKFIIATGRNIDSFRIAVQKYELDFFDYVICANGAVILNENLEIISFVELDNQIIERLDQIDKTINYGSKDVGVLVDDGQNKIYCMSYWMLDDESKDEFINKLAHKVEGMNILINGRYIDVVAKNVNKWDAFINVLIKQIADRKVIAIGDGENDIDILIHADQAFSFKESNKEVKANADVLIETFDEALLKIIF